jgi:hypothetical protein
VHLCFLKKVGGRCGCVYGTKGAVDRKSLGTTGVERHRCSSFFGSLHMVFAVPPGLQEKLQKDVLIVKIHVKVLCLCRNVACNANIKARC